MAGDGFPGVEWIPAHPSRFRVAASRQITEIVLHCTDGLAVDARQTARNVFGSKPAPDKNGNIGYQSAHYIVGRDGTIVQCVLHKDIAWHANNESMTTIGVEHNARDPGDTTLTEYQYWRSAQLVTWLTQRVGIPLDRWYIVGHSEIDPGTTHSGCPQRALDWDTYMTAIADVQRDARGEAFMRTWDRFDAH